MSFDLLPTMLNLAAVKPDTSLNLDGMDLSSLLQENSDLPERDLFWRYRGQKAVRNGPWKLLMLEDDTLLFNLSNDIEESNNIMTKHPERAKKLIAKYNQLGF